MLEEFLHKHDIDIALLQEITHPDLSTLRNYNAHINQRTEGTGTAILTKAELTVTNTKRLPSGRGIASIINGTWIIIIYTLHQEPKKRPREKYFIPATSHTSYQLQNLTCSSQATLTVSLKPMTAPDKALQQSARKHRQWTWSTRCVQCNINEQGIYPLRVQNSVETRQDMSRNI
jgi:hypothetical protein